MGIYATLGEIEMELTASPHTFSSTVRANYAEQSLIGRKSSLQFTGFSPDDISYGVKFHAQYCDPAAEYQKLSDVKDAKTPSALVFSNGDYRGTFVVTEIGLAVEHTASDGTLLAVETTVKLLEYIGDPAKPNPPGILTARLPIQSSTAPAIPDVTSPAGMLDMLDQALAVAGQVGEAASRVNDIVAQAQTDPLKAVGLAGQYAPELAEMAGQLPVEELQDLDQVVTIAGDAGQAANQMASVRDSLNTASTLLQTSDGLAGISSASGSIQSALTSAKAATPALSRLQAFGSVGSRIGGAKQ